MLRIGVSGAILLAGATLLVGVFWWIGSGRNAQDSPPVNGAIVLRRLQCQEQSNRMYRISVVGLNQTNQDLRQLSVEFNVGSPDELSKATAQVEYLVRGGVVNLTQEVAYGNDADVCFVKFYQGNNQIPSSFRP